MFVSNKVAVSPMVANTQNEEVNNLLTSYKSANYYYFFLLHFVTKINQQNASHSTARTYLISRTSSRFVTFSKRKIDELMLGYCLHLPLASLRNCCNF